MEKNYVTENKVSVFSFSPKELFRGGLETTTEVYRGKKIEKIALSPSRLNLVLSKARVSNPTVFDSMAESNEINRIINEKCRKKRNCITQKARRLRSPVEMILEQEEKKYRNGIP